MSKRVHLSPEAYPICFEKFINDKKLSMTSPQ